MVQNKTIGMLGGGVAGLVGAEKYSDDLALITMFYSSMARPPADVFQAVLDTLSTTYYVGLVIGSALLVRWLTKNAPDLLRGSPTSVAHLEGQPVTTKE